MVYMIRVLGLGLRGLSLPRIILFPIMLEISPSDKHIFEVPGRGRSLGITHALVLLSCSFASSTRSQHFGGNGSFDSYVGQASPKQIPTVFQVCLRQIFTALLCLHHWEYVL